MALVRISASVVPAFALTFVILFVLSNIKTTAESDNDDVVEDLQAVYLPPPPPPPPSSARTAPPRPPAQIPLDLSAGDAGVPVPISVTPMVLSGKPAPKPSFDFSMDAIRAANMEENMPDHVFQISEVSRPPEMIYKAFPNIKPSELAKTPKGEGRAVLLFIVDVDGVAREIHIVESSGSTTVDAAWVNAIRRSKFRPATRNGKAVRCWAKMPTVHFRSSKDLFSI